MVITRCCWEAQIEHLIVSRLRFVLDGAVLSNEQIEREETVARARAGANTEDDIFERTVIYSRSAVDDQVWAGRTYLFAQNRAGLTRAVSVLMDDLYLAMDLMRSPKPFVYKNIWLLNFVRLVWRWTKIGALPRISNADFRGWLMARMNDPIMDRIVYGFREYYDPRYLDPVRQERLQQLGENPLETLLAGLNQTGQDRRGKNISLEQWIELDKKDRAMYRQTDRE
jgi:hypothetical protein